MVTDACCHSSLVRSSAVGCSEDNSVSVPPLTATVSVMISGLEEPVMHQHQSKVSSTLVAAFKEVMAGRIKPEL